MSYDFATLQICTHRIVDDLVVFTDESRDTVAFPVQPVNDDVQVTIDGIAIPAKGLYARFPVIFAKAEPYRVVRNVSDLVLLQINNTVHTIELPPGSAKTALSLAAYLQTFSPDVVFSIENGHIIMKAAPGTTARFQDPRLTDPLLSLPSSTRALATYSNLGITPGRTAKTVKSRPGWSLEQDTGLNTTYLKFAEPIKNDTPVMLLSYTTVATFCPRCQGSSYEYDYRVKDSTFETVRNSDLLAQELDKFIFTRLGSHFKWTWMGSNLIDRIGGKSVGTQSIIDIDVTSAFSVYKNIKSQQSSLLAGQDVTDAEFPGNLVSVSSTVLPDDPTVVYSKIVVSNRSATAVELTRIVGTPDPFAALVAPDGSGPYTLRG
jgi:hypothetical protein